MASTRRIEWGISCCNPLEKNQTTASRCLRISAVALGTLLVITGVLALYGVPGLNSLGTTVGVGLIGGGGLTLLLGLILKRNEIEQERSDRRGYISNVRVPSSEGSSTSSRAHVTEESEEEIDLEHLSPDSLDDYLQNPHFPWGIMPDMFLRWFFLLKAPFTTSEDEADIAEKRSRMAKLPISSVNIILSRMEELITLLSDEQLKSQELCWDRIDDDGLRMLFDTSEDNIEESRMRMAKLPISSVNKILARLNDRQLLLLSDEQLQHEQLCWEIIRDSELQSLFPRYYFSGSAETAIEQARSRMAKLPISSVNKILARLSERPLSLLSDEHLSNPALKWTRLGEGQVVHVLPTTSYGRVSQEEENASIKRRLALLPISSLNQILHKLPERLLPFVPQEALQNKQLDLSLCSYKQVLDLLSAEKTTGFSWERPLSSERVKSISETVWRKLETQFGTSEDMQQLRQLRSQST